MKFEVSERIRTSKSQDEVLNSLESQFKKVARGTSRKGQVLAAVSIEASFGSINRKDTTVVEVERAEFAVGSWKQVRRTCRLQAPENCFHSPEASGKGLPAAKDGLVG